MSLVERDYQEPLSAKPPEFQEVLRHCQKARIVGPNKARVASLYVQLGGNT